MFISSLTEAVSIGAILPFLAALNSPDIILKNYFFRGMAIEFGLDTPSQLIFILTAVFVLVIIVAAAIRLLTLWATVRFSFSTGADLSVSIYRRTLYQPYAVHCMRNSSEIINVISNKISSAIYSVMIPVLTITSSIMMLIAILVVLIAMSPIIALASFGIFGLIYLGITIFVRQRLLIDSVSIARESSYVIKCIQEGLGGVRDILLDNNQEVHCATYNNADLILRRAQGNNVFISASPKFFLEALGMIFIIFLAFYLTQEANGITKAIPTLGALAYGAQRLLPTLHQVFASWTSIQTYQTSLKDTLELLDQKLDKHSQKKIIKPVTFQKSICFRKVSFKYNSTSPYILKDINMSIKKNTCIGFIGTTASGKSTFMDIFMGLLRPLSGNIEIDGKILNDARVRAWQKHIAHVPQNIFLTDGTIEENIALGVAQNKIDQEKLKKVAKQAQLYDYIEALPNKYQTFVGERGVRLSGGQRQRIGIARALYKEADVIIFDEAPSSLDSKTEREIMKAIDNLNQELTILIVAHRITTLKNCSKIYRLRNGRVEEMKNYKSVLNEFS